MFSEIPSFCVLNVNRLKAVEMTEKHKLRLRLWELLLGDPDQCRYVRAQRKCGVSSEEIWRACRGNTVCTLVESSNRRCRTQEAWGQSHPQQRKRMWTVPMRVKSPDRKWNEIFWMFRQTWTENRLLSLQFRGRTHFRKYYQDVEVRFFT